MRTRGLLLAVPSLAMTVVGVAMFGPGAVQAFDGARIRGGPYESLSEFSWRIAVLERFRSIDSTRDIGSIVVRARDAAGLVAEARCATGRDGTCDIALDFHGKLTGPVSAIVTAEGRDPPLAEGNLTSDTSAWGRAPGHPAELQGSTAGDFSIEVFARRGVFAAPFRDELTVVAREGGTPLRGAKVTLHADGADLDGGTEAPHRAPDTDATTLGDVATAGRINVASKRGEAIFGVTPRTHAVDVDIVVNADERSATWHGVLPVVPGAIWLAPYADLKIRVVAPVPREIVYATIAGPSARYWGGTIPLHVDANGFSTGEIEWPGPPRAKRADGAFLEPNEKLWLTLASDPLASGAGTVGWPVREVHTRGERPFRDLLLLDGMPAAEARDEHRRYRARSLSAVALGAAAVLEGVLLAQSAHARGLRAWAWTALAIGTVALAFAAIGIVVMWKTGG